MARPFLGSIKCFRERITLGANWSFGCSFSREIEVAGALSSKLKSSPFYGGVNRLKGRILGIGCDNIVPSQLEKHDPSWRLADGFVRESRVIHLAKGTCWQRNHVARAGSCKGAETIVSTMHSESRAGCCPRAWTIFQRPLRSPGWKFFREKRVGTRWPN